jgi:hypothetical protein
MAARGQCFFHYEARQDAGMPVGVFPVEPGNMDGTLNLRDAVTRVAPFNDIAVLQSSPVPRNPAVPPS